MKIGIDFGTTRIVVAVADRGNYPLVNFETPDGEVRDWFPSLLAIYGDKRAYGWDALEHQGEPGWTVVRSLKRWLKKAGPQSELKIAGQRLKLSQTLIEMMSGPAARVDGEIHVGSEQTRQAASDAGGAGEREQQPAISDARGGALAGFEVLGLLNEPSAAAVEFAYRNSSDRKHRGKGGLLVYDLGGGTFDVSLVALGDAEHSVMASDGHSGFWRRRFRRDSGTAGAGESRETSREGGVANSGGMVPAV